MELSQEELDRLQSAQDILELKDSMPFKKWLTQVVAPAIAEDIRQLTEIRQASWDHYLALWHHKEALEAIRDSLAKVEAGKKALELKAATEPPKGPATGELA